MRQHPTGSSGGPPLPEEGRRMYGATYAIDMSGTVFGEERVVMSDLPSLGPTIRQNPRKRYVFPRAPYSRQFQPHDPTLRMIVREKYAVSASHDIVGI